MLYKILILSGDTDYNKGDRAIRTAIIDMIKSEMKNNIKITIFSKFPKRDKKEFNVTVISKKNKYFFQRILTILRSDFVVWGGGVSLQDNSSKLKIPYWTTRIGLIKMIGKPVIGFGQGIGPLNSELGKKLTKIIVNRIDLITVRDQYSKNLLKDIGVDNTPIYALADPAVALKNGFKEKLSEILKKENISPNKKYIGIAPRLWFHHFGSFIPHKYAVKYGLRSVKGKEKFYKLKKIFTEILDYMIEKFNIEIIFFPMYPVSHEADDKICCEIIALMRNKNKTSVLKGDYSSKDLKGIFGKMEMFLGMRMHSTILSTIMNVPSINIYYVPKGLNFFKSIGQEKKAISVEELIGDEGLEKMKEIINNIWKNRELIKGELKKHMPIIKNKALENGHVFASFIKNLQNEKKINIHNQDID